VEIENNRRTTMTTISDNLLPSERKELLSEIQRLKAEKDAAYGSALRKVNRILLMCEFLTVDQKDELLSQIWDK
jgi:hypothetical protein